MTTITKKSPAPMGSLNRNPQRFKRKAYTKPGVRKSTMSSTRSLGVDVNGAGVSRDPASPQKVKCKDNPLLSPLMRQRNCKKLVSKPICPKGYYLPSYSPGTLRNCIELPPSTFEGDNVLVGPPTVIIPPPELVEVCTYYFVSGLTWVEKSQIIMRLKRYWYTEEDEVRIGNMYKVCEMVNY